MSHLHSRSVYFQVRTRFPTKKLAALRQINLFFILVASQENGVITAAAANGDLERGQVRGRHVLLIRDPEVARIVLRYLPAFDPPCPVPRASEPQRHDRHAELPAEIAAYLLAKTLRKAVQAGIVQGNLFF